MDWDAIQKRENKKAIEARKYGELLKQQNEEIKERKLKEKQFELEEAKKFFLDSQKENNNSNNNNNNNNNNKLFYNTKSRGNEFNNSNKYNLFLDDPLLSNLKNSINVNSNLLSNSNNRSINTLFNQNNSNITNSSLTTLNNNSIINDSNNSFQNLKYYNNPTKTNIINDSGLLLSNDYLRSKKIEDVHIENIPISHILVKIDKLQQLYDNNSKIVENLNNRCEESTLHVNEIKNHLLERIEKGESKIIQLIYSYTEKQKNLDLTWRNEQADQLQMIQNSLHNVENYIQNLNTKISEHDSSIEYIQGQFNTMKKRLDGLEKNVEFQLQKLKQDMETNQLNIEKKFENFQEELNAMFKNNEKSYHSKLNCFKEDLQTEKSIQINTINDLKKNINTLSDIIRKIEEKEVLETNSLKESIISTQSVVDTTLKEKDVQLRQYIDQSYEILTSKFNEKHLQEQQKITEMAQKIASITNLFKEKLEGIIKQQTYQVSDYKKSMVDVESKLTNSLQQKVKEILIKLSETEEGHKKSEEDKTSFISKMSEKFKELEKQCNHDINMFKVTYNAKLDETFQNYEEDIKKQLTAKDNIIEEINYKIVQLFSKVNNQEEAHQSNSRELSKMIQEFEANEKESNTSRTKEMNSMINELKEKYQEIENKFSLVGEEQKKSVSDIENKFKFKYIQIDQILEAYKENFKSFINKKDIDEIIGQMNQSTETQIQEMKKIINDHQNLLEKELNTVHINVADQLHKIEEDLAKAKTTYISQYEYQELIDKIDNSNKYFNNNTVEINQMIDRMNHSLEVIDSNLVTNLTNNYNELTKKIDCCVNNYNNTLNVHQTQQGVIQKIKDDIEKIKESVTTHKKGLSENEKISANQTKLLNSINESVEKLKQTNDLKISKRECQDCLLKLENEYKDLTSMYEQVRQDYRSREINLEIQIKKLEDQLEENNNDTKKQSKQFKIDMEENLHKINKQIVIIENYINENKEKQRSIDEVLNKRDIDSSSTKSIKLELDFLQEKVEKLPSEESMNTFLKKATQSIKESQEYLENEISNIKKVLKKHSLNNLSIDTNKNDEGKLMNSNLSTTNESLQKQEIIINQDKDKEIIKEVNQREVELSSGLSTEKSASPPPRPAVIITTREIIPLQYNISDTKPKNSDTNSTNNMNINEIKEENKNEKENNKNFHKKEESH
ncbi:hypothetical protein BCR36DRAFT_456503 [Piromyces finnis]|uniref:Uncharacterized protein n=1 Tax=Piromyces finnis TaxID=1754191 RepID=A0A1Y1V2I4_9FUNG|nr:hypothetical protein BCR36DRAFT_456503 [Piromyces finnis]|eukprot:ORX45784.1 hypothetical protein BCR36DRAFT_456503 [Piromyces finnis]